MKISDTLGSLLLLSNSFPQVFPIVRSVLRLALHAFFESFLEYYCGFKAWSFHKNDSSFDTGFIENMPSYPRDGSIKVLDNKIIIKFSDFAN